MQNYILTKSQMQNQIINNQNDELLEISKSSSDLQNNQDILVNNKLIYTNNLPKTYQNEILNNLEYNENELKKEDKQIYKNINNDQEYNLQKVQQNNHKQKQQINNKYELNEIGKGQQALQKQNKFIDKIMNWQVFYVKQQFQITQKQVFNTIEQIQQQIQSQKLKLELLKKQSLHIQTHHSFQQEPDYSIIKNGYETQQDQSNANWKSQKVLAELQKEQIKKFPKVDIPILKYAQDDQYKLIEYKKQLQQKRRQLKQAKQQQRIRRIEQKIAQLQIHIRRIEQKQSESQKQIIFMPNKKVSNQRQQITKIIPITRKFKKKLNVQQINFVKQDGNKKLFIEQARNQHDKKQEKKNNVNLIQKQKKLQLCSNIYNVALGELLLVEKQMNNGNLKSQSNEFSNNNKINEDSLVQQKQKSPIKNQEINIPIKSQLQIQKQRLEQQVKMLKKKIEELQKLIQINNNTIPYDSNTFQVKPQITQQLLSIDHNNTQLTTSKIKFRQLHWHSDKKYQLGDSRLKSNQLPEVYTNFSNPEQQKKFRTNLIRPPSKRLERKNLQIQIQQTENKKNQTIFPKQEKEIKKQEKQIIQSKYVNQTPKKITLNNMEFPKLSLVPQAFHTSKQLIQIGKKTFEVFGIKVQQSQVFNVKKFKNCVYFNLNSYHIVWYYGGKFYIGGWKNNFSQGQKQGFGIQYIPQKYLYEGNFKQGRRCGYGIMKYQNGDIYTGDWLEGLRNGNGRWQQSNGLVYDGQWRQGKKQGFGKLLISTNQIYQGMFLRNLKNGYGKEIFKNGDSYHGQYMMNKFSGKGCYKWANGAFYQGQFYNGCRNGHGLWKSGPITPCDTYEGQYINDKKCGKGKYIWENGSSYQGQFLNDLKHGQGTLRFLGGKILRAIWQNGVAKKKLFSEQEELYRQSKKPPRVLSATKYMQETERSITAKNYRISNKSTSRVQQKSSNDFMKQSGYRKMQQNSTLRVGDL